MAEDVDPESKTEDPSPKRREDARRQGQIPFSADAVSALVLLVGVVGLGPLGEGIWSAMFDVYRHDLRHLHHPDLGPDGAQELLTRPLVRMLIAMAPFFGLLVGVGLAAGIVQVGFQITPEKLEPKFDKLNPATNAGRLFSTAAVVKALLTLAKVAALGVVAYLLVARRAGTIITLGRQPLGGATLAAWELILQLALYLAAAVAAVAVADYVYQRRRFEIGLRMTKQEVKDELKQEEGDPLIKSRMRQLARERAKRRMLAEVPKATVVITNPTHYAVALRYKPPADESPIVVARGSGAIAEAIRELARKHSVPVLERPALARVLYAVKEGRPVPGPLFQAVAEVIAFVYRLRGVGPQPNPPGV